MVKGSLVEAPTQLRKVQFIVCTMVVHHDHVWWNQFQCKFNSLPTTREYTSVIDTIFTYELPGLTALAAALAAAVLNWISKLLFFLCKTVRCLHGIEDLHQTPMRNTNKKHNLRIPLLLIWAEWFSIRSRVWRKVWGDHNESHEQCKLHSNKFLSDTCRKK